MKILVINAGSSSMKFQLYDMENENVCAKGSVQEIGEKHAMFSYETQKGKQPVTEVDIKNYTQAVNKIFETLFDEELGVIRDKNEISAVGHRIVHGGEAFSNSVLIDDEVLEVLKDNIELAPLHNPANIMAVEACRAYVPNAAMVGVFDTAFHQSIPPKAYLYALPFEAYKKYKIRKYGFHGSSHKYSATYAAQKLGKKLSGLKIICCHLGNGSSVAAIKDGKSIDTSMGFTPLEGLVMGTRSGSIDPTVVQYLINKMDITVDEAIEYLNKKSGVLGISGVSSDFREIEDDADRGNERAKLALDIFCYRVRKYIGAYIAVMGGVDVIIFTAGIGENSPRVRRMIIGDMDCFGIKLDQDKNNTREEIISAPESDAVIMVVHTNEELLIARETKRICESILEAKP